MITLDRAILLATHAHFGQKDKAGASYILHPLRVMANVAHLGEDAMVVGVLHDTIEDALGKNITDETVALELKKYEAEGLTESQLAALNLLTHRTDHTYDVYIEMLRANKLASAIKVADLEDNMDIKRIKNRRNLKQADLERLQKYLRAWTKLTGQ